MGIVFSGMFAVGLVIFASVDTDQHLMHILFGNILGITPDVLIQISAICLITITIMLVKQKDFMLYCFDPNQARIVGLPVALLHYGLLSILALTIVASMQAVGIILVVAMLISPGITAYLLTRSFSRMITLAILFSVISSVIGTFISFHIDGATGPSIVLTQAVFFIIALLCNQIKLAKIKRQTKPANA